MQIAAFGVLFMQMFQCPLPVSLPVELGIVRQAELDGAADNGDGLDHPVRLSDEAAVDAAGRGGGGGAVVFGRLGYGLDLILGEPLPQAPVGPDDAAAFQVVRLAVDGKPQVVAGSGGVEHLLVYVVRLAHGEGPFDYRTGVVFPVCHVEGGVAGDDLALYVILKAFPYHKTPLR